MLRYLHYNFNDERENKEKLKDAAKKFTEKYHSNETISFEELKKDGFYNAAIKCIEWAYKRVEYAFNELDKIDINTFGRKRSFESMLDQL